MQIVRDEPAAGRARIAQTLVKEGALRLTLGDSVPAARLMSTAEGPVTIHVLDGELDLNASGETHAHRVGRSSRWIGAYGTQ